MQREVAAPSLQIDCTNVRARVIASHLLLARSGHIDRPNGRESRSTTPAPRTPTALRSILSLTGVTPAHYHREYSMTWPRPVIAVLMFTLVSWAAPAQEKSVKPGINAPFKNPDVKDFEKKFEGESREVFAKRDQIVAACKLKPGTVVADVGAGTGLFTRLLAKEIGPDGQVYAVDIAPTFLEHVQETSRKAGLRNVTPVLCNQDAVDLPPNSVDLAYVCDTYHHFEFPERTLTSLY